MDSPGICLFLGVLFKMYSMVHFEKYIIKINTTRERLSVYLKIYIIGPPVAGCGLTVIVNKHNMFQSHIFFRSDLLRYGPSDFLFQYPGQSWAALELVFEDVPEQNRVKHNDNTKYDNETNTNTVPTSRFVFFSRVCVLHFCWMHWETHTELRYQEQTPKNKTKTKTNARRMVLSSAL